MRDIQSWHKGIQVYSIQLIKMWGDGVEKMFIIYIYIYNNYIFSIFPSFLGIAKTITVYCIPVYHLFPLNDKYGTIA